MLCVDVQPEGSMEVLRATWDAPWGAPATAHRLEERHVPRLFEEGTWFVLTKDVSRRRFHVRVRSLEHWPKLLRGKGLPERLLHHIAAFAGYLNCGVWWWYY